MKGKVKYIIALIAVCLAIIAVLLCVYMSRLRDGEQGKSGDIAESASDIAESYSPEENPRGEFSSIYYAGSVNGTVFTVKSDGIYRAPLSLSGEERIYEGNVSSQIITDGYTLYFVDRDTFEVKSIDLSDNSQRAIYSLYGEKGQDLDDYFKDGYIDGFANGYLYFEEWYTISDYTTYIYNTESGECVTSGDYLGDMQSYGDDIYFIDLRFELTYGPLYRAKADGSGKETVAEHVGVFKVKDNLLYYSESEDGKTSVKAENLDTGEAETILSMAGIDVYNITDTALHYRDSAGADYIYHFDGEAIDSVEGLYGIYQNHVVCRDEEDGVVTFTDTSDGISASIDDIDYAVNYISGIIWYIDNDGELKYKKLT